MFHSAKEFTDEYGPESQLTARVLGALTDASLSQRKLEGHNTLGELAWHIVTAPSYMLNATGYSLPEFSFELPPDLTAEKIRQTQRDLSQAMLEQTAAKSTDDLNKLYSVFGRFERSVIVMLIDLFKHEIHHRGQLTVLMRQAGLVVPSMYGPNHEETQEFISNMSGS